MIHPCCDSRCWKDNEPALFHTHQCLQKTPHRINYDQKKFRSIIGKPGTGTLKHSTHPHTCGREASSRVCSRGICSPLAPNTSYMSRSMLRGMKEKNGGPIFHDLKLDYLHEECWKQASLSEAPAQAPKLSLERFSLK